LVVAISVCFHCLSQNILCYLQQLRDVRARTVVRRVGGGLQVIARRPCTQLKIRNFHFNCYRTRKYPCRAGYCANTRRTHSECRCSYPYDDSDGDGDGDRFSEVDTTTNLFIDRAKSKTPRLVLARLDREECWYPVHALLPEKPVPDLHGHLHRG
jgi:hypothetical protein